MKSIKKLCRNLNYFEHSFLFIFAVTACLSISDIASLVGILVGTASSALGFKMCEITAGQLLKKEEEAW